MNLPTKIGFRGGPPVSQGKIRLGQIGKYLPVVIFKALWSEPTSLLLLFDQNQEKITEIHDKIMFFAILNEL